MLSPKFEFYLTVGVRLHVVPSFLSLESAHLIPSDQTDRIVFPEFALSEDGSLRLLCVLHTHPGDMHGKPDLTRRANETRRRHKGSPLPTPAPQRSCIGTERR
jgi:hypothetical protein